MLTIPFIMLCIVIFMYVYSYICIGTQYAQSFKVGLLLVAVSSAIVLYTVGTSCCFSVGIRQ